MKKGPFKMNGWSGYQASPIKQIPKDFNIVGSDWPVKTPGYKETKIAKSKHWESFEKFQSQTKKAQEWKKDIMKQVKVSKKPTSKLDKAKKILSTNLKSAGKILRKRFLKF